MAQRLPPLNSLAAFEAAARLTSFTRAASELHVTPAAISRHVKLLEGWLGRLLFDRRHRGVVLTLAGEEYVRECTAALDRISRATALQLNAARRRLLRVDTMGTFAMRWLIPKLSSFQLTHPDVEVRLTTSQASIADLRPDVDVVVRGGPETIAGYTATEFLRERRTPVCSPSLLRKIPLRSPADLRRHTLLHSATLPGVWPAWLEAAGVPALEPRASLTLEHFYLTLQAAVDGLGVAIGPAALVADDVGEGRLVAPLRERGDRAPLLPEWRYFAYVRNERAAVLEVVAFRNWLVDAGARAPQLADAGGTARPPARRRRLARGRHPASSGRRRT